MVGSSSVLDEEYVEVDVARRYRIVLGDTLASTTHNANLFYTR
jgi:hypothetical protein